jgi:hypothetical protein
VRAEILSFDFETGWSDEFPSVADPSRTLVLAFGAADPFRTDPVPLKELAVAYPGATVAGCSTAGEIHDASVRDDSLSVAVVEFTATRLRSAASPCAFGDRSELAGRELAEALAAPDLAAVLVLSDGLNVNGSDLVRGLSGRLGPDVPITGGLAGDGDRFDDTWVLVDDEPASGWISAIGFYGPAVRYGHGSQGGWDIFGPERMVTRSEGNVLFELDGKPALELYKQYLGELAQGLPATGLLFPLAVREPGTDRHLVRTILAVDEASQSMVFAGDVPEGHRARLMQANFDRLIGGAEAAADQVESTPHPVLAVAISCVGRRLVLGERTEEETEATLDRLPDGSHQIGFYSYGEISPYADGTCDLHNQTMTITTISEDP